MVYLRRYPFLTQTGDTMTPTCKCEQPLNNRIGEDSLIRTDIVRTP